MRTRPKSWGWAGDQLALYAKKTSESVHRNTRKEGKTTQAHEKFLGDVTSTTDFCTVYLIKSSFKMCQRSFMIYFKTFTICAAFFSLGLSISCLGPTLPTLAINLNTTLTSLSFVLPARGIGYMIGSLVSGFLYEFVDSSVVLFSSLFITAAGNVAIPFLNYSVIVAAVFSTIGFSMGVLDTGGNVFILDLWKKESAPYMQLVHFMFGLGATMTPLFAEPFIKSTTTNLSTQSAINKSFDDHNNDDESFPYVAWPYLICAIFTFSIATLFIYIYVDSKRQSTATNREKNNPQEEESTIEEEGKKFRLMMLVFLFLLFFVYVGMEVAFGTYLYTFATTCQNPMDKKNATLLNTAFWASLALGRLLAIFISIKLSAKVMMIINLLLTLISSLTFLFYPLYAESAQFILWIVTIVYGLGIASIFPTGISWGDEFITINGKAASALVVGGSVGEMLVPLLVGSIIETNPMNLMYVVIGCSLAMTLLFVILNLIAHTKGKRRKLKKKKCDEKTEQELLPTSPPHQIT